jgi:hypothetical protein
MAAVALVAGISEVTVRSGVFELEAGGDPDTPGPPGDGAHRRAAAARAWLQLAGQHHDAEGQAAP